MLSARSIKIGCGTFLAILLVASAPAALAIIGPDVIVGELNGIQRWGSLNGFTAYSVGTTSCNIGDTDVEWQAGNNHHPVIGQNLYRYKNGKFEQIGQSWLKHGFTAVNNGICGSCNGHLGAVLGIGCSDPYGSGLNGGQSGLGPRWQVNPFTGVYSFPHAEGTQGSSGDDIYKRLQVNNDDLKPAFNTGARYFAEGHYVTFDDAQAGNQFNNVSYQEVVVTETSANVYQIGFLSGSSTVRKSPAILVWASIDSTVRITTVNVPGDGRMILAAKVSQNGSNWKYEYALYNMNSNRGANAFVVPLPQTANVVSVGFHDVNYHSGDGEGAMPDPTYDTTDWAMQVGGGVADWFTDSHAININANALRWGCTYNFRFETNVPPAHCDGPVTISMYRDMAGQPASIAAMTLVPSLCTTRGDLDGDNLVTGSDISHYVGMRLGTEPVSPCADVAAPMNGALNTLDDSTFINILMGGTSPCQ